MSDEKTSQLPDAATLDGTELVGIVQGGVNVQTTTAYVANVINDRSYVQIGAFANGGGEQGVAIGFYAGAFGPNPIAIGNSAYAVGLNPIAVGYRADATNTGAIALGTSSAAHSTYAIAIGGHASSNGTYAIAMGGYASAEARCIAIGAYSKGWDNFSIAIGANSKAYGNYAIAVGYHAQSQSSGSITIGSYTYAQFKSVALGYRSHCSGEYAVCIGNFSECLATYCVAIGTGTYAVGTGSVAVGPYSGASSTKAISLGAYSHARAAYAVSIGAHSNAGAAHSFALGSFANTTYAYSMVIGSSTTDRVVGSLVIGGFPTEFALHPCEHYQKFIGATVPAASAVAVMDAIGVDSAIGIVTATPGSAGNSYFLATTNPGVSNTLGTSWDGTTLTILLGTDSDGNLDNTQNTLGNIASLFPTHGFTFSIEGPSDDVVVALIDVQFADGLDNTPGVLLTADGNSPGSTNQLALWSGSVATLTGRVTAAGTNIFTSSDDTACWVLTPLMVYRVDDGTYNFVGSPTFTMENNTAGASEWAAPELAISDGFLEVAVVNTTEAVNWMAHFKFESSQ